MLTDFFRYLVIFGWLFIFKNRKCKIREVQSIRWELSTYVGFMAEEFQFRFFFLPDICPFSIFKAQFCAQSRCGIYIYCSDYYEYIFHNDCEEFISISFNKHKPTAWEVPNSAPEWSTEWRKVNQTWYLTSRERQTHRLCPFEHKLYI